MYINFWYPVGLSEEITKDKPFKVQILGLKFVAFRDSDGNARVLSDTCVHRGGSLSNGWVKDGCVVCPYHGWEYAGDGKCVFVPTLPAEQKLPARAKVDSYPTQEKYGIVFAFLGDLPKSERPPIYEIEQFGAEGWRANENVAFTVNAFYERSMENGLDAAHNEFVHPAQGNPSIRETIKRQPVVVEDCPPWGSRFMMVYSGYAAEESRTLSSGYGSTRAGSEHHGPNTLITRIIFSDERQFFQVFFEAPIDENSTRIFFVNMRSFMLEPEHDAALMKVNMQVAEEDIRIVEALDPIRTPRSTTKELLLPQDKPIVAYRRYLQEWEDRGWRIDASRFRAEAGDTAFAIPCPARREGKNWVLDPVPLMPADENEPVTGFEPLSQRSA
jgi:phenylpropionate dioxygenase-like ring-hydroxylating dioxygenase large terminal subunit